MPTLPIPLTELGLYGGRNLNGIPPQYLLKANNIAFSDGCLRKEGGADRYNSPFGLFFSFTERANPKNFALNDITWNGSSYIAVGAADGTDAYIVTSSDGITWTERAPNVAKNIALNCVTTNPNLAQPVVAVGAADGTDAYIVTSTLGTTWVERANPKNFALNGVTSDNAIFLAVGAADGTDAYIVSSSNGTAWTEQANPKNFALNYVTWVPYLSLFVAVGDADGTDAYIVTSPDGVTWTERANPKNFQLTDIESNGSLLVAVGAADGTDAYLITSTDGITWTERSNPKNFGLNCVFWNGTGFYAGGAADGTDGYLITSTNGIDWIEVPNPKNFGINGIMFSGNKYAFCGAADGTDAYLFTGTFASDAVEISNPKSINLRDVIWTGNNFVAVGEADGTDAYILTSPDGTTWTERANPQNVTLSRIAKNGSGRLVAVGDPATSPINTPYIVTSNDDGVTWTQRTFAGTRTLNSITWNGEIFVAVGEADGTDAAILTSPEGVNWVERSNPKNFALNDITWNGDIFVAVGDNEPAGDAYLVTSADGITWTERSNPRTVGNLQRLSWTGSQFITDSTTTIGGGNTNEGVLVANSNLFFSGGGMTVSVLTSTDGITWAEQETVSYSNDNAGGNILGVSFDGETWFGVATPNQSVSTIRGIAFDGQKIIGVGTDASATDGYIVSMTLATPYFLGAAYWNYNGSAPKVVGLDSSGRLLMDDYDGVFDVVLKVGLTVTTNTFPVFVEGGKEVAANNKKLFTFTGANAVQVLSGAGTSTTDIATPPADWAAANQPTGGLIHDYRLWGYGNANDPHRLYYSLTTNHEDFTTSGAGSLSIYPGQGEKIVNAISYKGMIIVFKYPKGIYFVDTTSISTTGWRVGRINENLGAAGAGSAVIVEEDVLFADHVGEIRLLAGISEYGDIGSRSLSDTHDISVFIRDNYYLPSNTKWRMHYYPTKREVHLAASSNLLGINDNRMVIDFNRQTPRFRNCDRDICVYFFTREVSGVPELMSCDNLGNIWRMDQDERSKDGIGYECEAQTTHIDFGDSTVDKNGDSIEVAYEPSDGDVTLLVDVIWDGVFQETTTILLDKSDDVLPGRMILNKSVPLNGSGRRISLVFRNFNASEDIALQGVWIHYTVGGEAEEP